MREFHSLAHFAAHLALVAERHKLQQHRTLDKIGAVLQADMGKQLGHYQPEVGYFPPWSPLAESTVAEHARFGVGDTPLVLHGELYASISHEVAGHEVMAGSKSDIAVYQELGTSMIPPRAFVGPAGFRNAEKIAKLAAHDAASALLYGSGETVAPLLGE